MLRYVMGYLVFGPPSVSAGVLPACRSSGVSLGLESLRSLAILGRFFYADTAVADAKAYCLLRRVDAMHLRSAMSFTFHTEYSLRCSIYGHTIVLALKDNALHSGQPHGQGDFYINGNSAEGNNTVFEDIDQVYAYMLANNW